jgi:hypothetical protein
MHFRWSLCCALLLVPCPTTSRADIRTVDGYWYGQPVANPPAPRDFHLSIYDPVRDRMYVLGGSGGTMGEVQVLSLSGTPEWSSFIPAGSPPDVQFTKGIYDPVRDRIVLFGGVSDLTFSNDVWALALAGTPTWSKLTPAGTRPAGRDDHSVVYDSVRDRLLVFGGTDTYDNGFNDVWSLTLSGTPMWTPLTPGGTPPPPRFGHTAIYDAARDRMVIFGGANSVNSMNDVWALALGGSPAWTPLAPTGTPPSPRFYHSAILEPARDRMIAFGGLQQVETNEAWALSLAATPAWTTLAPSGAAPSARFGHTAVFRSPRDQMLVYGGNDGSDGDPETWALSWLGPAAAPVATSDRELDAVVFPNPVCKRADVRFTVPREERATLRIVDVAGRTVSTLWDGVADAGEHLVTWRPAHGVAPSGLYFCVLAADGHRVTQRLVLVD